MSSSSFYFWNSMMTKIAVAFDLDGTLSDSSEGIIKSMNYALAEMGRNPLTADRLVPFIGPPITDIFQALLGSSDPSIIMEGVRYFRKRYFDVGFKENRLYEGIPEMLERLKDYGHILYVATSKSPQNAVETVRFLGIETYFEAVLGSGIQRKKHDILNDIVSGNKHAYRYDRGSEIRHRSRQTRRHEDHRGDLGIRHPRRTGGCRRRRHYRYGFLPSVRRKYPVFIHTMTSRRAHFSKDLLNADS